jgi:signal peptidase II
VEQKRNGVEESLTLTPSIRDVSTSLDMTRRAEDVKFILFLSLPLYAVDQLTKQLVLRLINPYEAHIIVPDFFSLVNVTNTGAAFGSFRGNNVFFIVISIIALVVVVTLLVRPRAPDKLRDLSLALLLAGILGNVTDRLLFGHVIDFLLFNLHIRYADPWPAFNVADSCISIAVFLFIIHSFRKQKSAG